MYILRGSISTRRRSRFERIQTSVTNDASPLKAAFAKKIADGKKVNIAMTFPGGTHDLWIRYWIAAGGIDPTRTSPHVCRRRRWWRT